MSKAIRVIDLLNKIANGEDVPELIEYNGENYIFQNKDYKNEDRDLYLFSEETPDITAALNDEVKIIETIEEQEEIDIQSIEELDENFTYIENHSSGLGIEKVLNKAEIELVNKINKLVQAVKQLDKKIKEKE